MKKFWIGIAVSSLVFISSVFASSVYADVIDLWGWLRIDTDKWIVEILESSENEEVAVTQPEEAKTDSNPVAVWWITWDPYFQAAMYLWEKWFIVNDPNKFNIDGKILRQEMAWTFAKVMNLPNKEKCDNIFADVSATKPNEWVCGRVEALVEASYIAKNKNYRPMSNITKIEALGFLANTLFKEQYTEIRDKNVSWEESAVDFFTNKVNFLTKEEIGDYKEESSRWFVFYILAKALKEKA